MRTLSALCSVTTSPNNAVDQIMRFQRMKYRPTCLGQIDIPDGYYERLERGSFCLSNGRNFLDNYVQCTILEVLSKKIVRWTRHDSHDMAGYQYEFNLEVMVRRIRISSTDRRERPEDISS